MADKPDLNFKLRCLGIQISRDRFNNTADDKMSPVLYNVCLHSEKYKALNLITRNPQIKVKSLGYKTNFTHPRFIYRIQ